ncbi:S41 family peptidase [Undibacterium sp. Ji67W]|uniref:S41 family peptidase n=1 Tax=Undibacterium sp. Ji67W TaxID=3413042 RepID=UPI003BF1A195
MKKILSLSLVSILAACGGGGGSSGSSGSSGSVSSVLPPSASLANQCAAPRPNTVDVQGSADTEKAYLRSFVDETYLWYKDVPTNLIPSSFATPQTYFDALKTPLTTASGKPVDQFHWSQTTASWNAASSGISQDYGVQWAAQSLVPPRVFIAAEVASGSPAALAGVKRGDKVLTVDGVDLVNDNTQAGIDILNEGLFPTKLAAHTIGFSGKSPVTMTPATYTVATVKNVSTIQTANGAVGYFAFDTHIQKSEAELISAISQLQAAGVTDLVIDLRYNGGGLLYIASELAYMIAGPTTTANKIFEQLTYNDKLTSKNQIYPFYSSSTTNQALPTLGLNHVTLLVTGGTASASESIINSLRGVGVKVDLIGATTRGKPYGFVPQDNCSYTYFSIQFKGQNNMGYGDYADGFAPTCNAPDDFTHLRGDPSETMLKTALNYRLTNVCPANVTSTTVTGFDALNFNLIRPQSQEMRIVTPKPGL